MKKKKFSIGSISESVRSQTPTPFEEVAPELNEEWFETADMHIGGKMVSRGRPKSDSPKHALTIRMDRDIVQQFRASGRGWQTRINAALKDWLKHHDPKKL